MKRQVFGVLYLLLYLVQSAPNVFSGQPSMWNTAPAAVSTKALDADAAAVTDTRTYLQRLEKLGFAGVVLVAKGGAPIFAEGFGLADREQGLRWTPATVSCIGSITKQFTGAAILKLEEDKKLSVADPIGLYFEDVPADKAQITLHHLLTHSSGLSDPEDIDDFDPVPLAEYLRKVLSQPLLFAPGPDTPTRNANFSLLGAIIEKLSGMSYEAFVRERLFLPSGMYETGYLLPAWGDGRMAQGYRAGERWGTILGRPMAVDGPHWALRANGGIHSTAYDMLRWARSLLDGPCPLARVHEEILGAPRRARAAIPSTATAGRSPGLLMGRRSSPTTAATASSSPTWPSSRTRGSSFFS